MKLVQFNSYSWLVLGENYYVQTNSTFLVIHVLVVSVKKGDIGMKEV